MKILALTRRRPGATYDEIQKLQYPEASEVWQLYSEGLIREIYFDPEKPAVALILEAGSIPEAAERLARLPMVKSNLIEFDYMALGPFRQFEHLFAARAG
jgi:hypothetical protein